MRKSLFFVVLIVPFMVKGQAGTIIDSLTQATKNTNDPKELFSLYDELVTQWAEANFDSSYYYAQKLYRLSNRLSDSKFKSKALLRLGTPHDYHSHFDSAAYYYEKSLRNSEASIDSGGKIGRAHV